MSHWWRLEGEGHQLSDNKTARQALLIIFLHFASLDR